MNKLDLKFTVLLFERVKDILVPVPILKTYIS